MNQMLVIDCSFLMSCIPPDEERIFDDISQCILYVPAIFYTECGSVLNTAINRTRIIEKNAEEYLNIIRSFTIEVDIFCSKHESMLIIHNIARQNRLTPYDACYFELAKRLNSPIATRDKALIKACQENSILIFE